MEKAVIVGASSGIGREMALWFARRGWRVAVAGRREAMLQDVVHEYPDNMLYSVVDVTRTEALPEALDRLAERLGGMDLLVVSAGTGFINPQLDPEPERATVATNVEAFTALAVWGYGYFKKQGRGRLAAITSVGGLVAEGSAPAYPASKAYQILYLDSLRKKARKDGLACTITELRPGSVDTDMMKGEGHFWISSPAAAADQACRAIVAGRKLRYISRRWGLIGFLLRAAKLFS